MSERLLFIRHAQTTTNTEGRIHRRGSVEHLDATGKIQAQQLVEVCRRNNVQVLYTSPEDRARETAEIIGQGLHIKPHTLEELRERNWGEWEGRPWQEVEKILTSMTLEERYTFVPPGGESWKHMEERLQQAIDFITAQGHTVSAIITHGGALRGLMPLLENAPKETSLQYNFNNASVTTFDYENGKFVEIGVNDIAHLQ